MTTTTMDTELTGQSQQQSGNNRGQKSVNWMTDQSATQSENREKTDRKKWTEPQGPVRLQQKKIIIELQNTKRKKKNILKAAKEK